MECATCFENFCPKNFWRLGENGNDEVFERWGWGGGLWGFSESTNEAVFDSKQRRNDHGENEEGEIEDVGDQKEKVVGEIIENGGLKAGA
jgi:hypothetical protein